jgi:hypothetical protein
MNYSSDRTVIIALNMLGVVVAYGLLALSLYLSTEVPLATKGYWGMGIVLLTLSLINVVKYRFDVAASDDRISKLENAKNERLLETYVGSKEG